MSENIHEAKVLQRFVQSRDNDVDVDLCDITVYWVSLLHYFNVQEIS